MSNISPYAPSKISCPSSMGVLIEPLFLREFGLTVAEIPGPGDCVRSKPSFQNPEDGHAFRWFIQTDGRSIAVVEGAVQSKAYYFSENVGPTVHKRRGRMGKVGHSVKVGPHCHNDPDMHCSQMNGSSIYRPAWGHRRSCLLGANLKR